MMKRTNSEQMTVLDEIRAEIVHLHDWAFDRAEVLRIIDKYRAKFFCDNCKTPCIMYEKGMRGCGT